jgi:AmiR/NasT family two-component response regulator
MEQGPANGDATRALVAHVERVLAGGGVRENLQSLLNQYAGSLDDRRLVAKAKDLLQQKFGWTEDQAYLHLRNASRRSRKRMFEVARDLLERGAGRIERLSA